MDRKELIEALEKVSIKLICRPFSSNDAAHYCPNCDNSLYDVRQEVRDILAALRAREEQ